MNGFGFLEYKNSLDANDVVPAFRRHLPLIAYLGLSC